MDPQRSVEKVINTGYEAQIAAVVSNAAMYQISGKETIDISKLAAISQYIAGQYTKALTNEDSRKKRLSELKAMRYTKVKDDAWVTRLETLIKEDPELITFEDLIGSIGDGSIIKDVPESIRGQVALILMKNAPATVVSKYLYFAKEIPIGTYLEMIQIGLKKDQTGTAFALIMNLKKLPADRVEELAKLALDNDSETIVGHLTLEIEYLPEQCRYTVARLAFAKNPKLAAIRIVETIIDYPAEFRPILLNLALEANPEECALALLDILDTLPVEIQDEFKNKLLSLKNALEPVEDQTEMNFENLPKEERPQLAIDEFKSSPSEKTAARVITYLVSRPPKERIKIARKALKIDPQKFAPALIIYLANYDKYSNTGGDLDIYDREFLATEAFKAAPEEVADKLASIRYLEYRPRIRNKVIDMIIREKERKVISESEKLNPRLYPTLEGLEEPYSRREFEKTGSRTVLLGGTLVNKVILRIIPNYAFINWLKAYSAAEKWKRFGFNYVPIEPILRATICKDGNYTRVYSGVLGISVERYLEMHSNSNYHNIVRNKMEDIKRVLERMEINHGDTHEGNFCVQHLRTPDGEIDWSTPPRVYLIDFDNATDYHPVIRRRQGL